MNLALDRAPSIDGAGRRAQRTSIRLFGSVTAESARQRSSSTVCKSSPRYLQRRISPIKANQREVSCMILNRPFNWRHANGHVHVLSLVCQVDCDSIVTPATETFAAQRPTAGCKAAGVAWIAYETRSRRMVFPK